MNLETKPLFDAALKALLKEIRAKLEACDISAFNLVVKAGGQVTTGDLNVTVTMCKNTYDPDVDGGDVEAVFNEFIRRTGWNEANAPLCLPRVE